MNLVARQLSAKATLHTIAHNLNVGRAQLEQHLNQCVRQDSARGTEIDLNLLMELPPFIVPEEWFEEYEGHHSLFF